MNIIYISTKDLREYENNPRNNDFAVDKVAASIDEFGFKYPIIIDKNNVIVAGHTRLKAARKLGLDVVPCLIADDLTDEQIKAFRLVDNKTAELSGWNFEKLEAELSGISERFNMADFGFDLDTDDVDIDGFFEETETKEKEPKKIQCPHCGEWFEA